MAEPLRVLLELLLVRRPGKGRLITIVDNSKWREVVAVPAPRLPHMSESLPTEGKNYSRAGEEVGKAYKRKMERSLWHQRRLGPETIQGEPGWIT